MKFESLPKSLIIGDKVEVRWHDALSCRHMEQQGAAWVHYDIDETWDLPVLVTTGYLLHVDHEKVVISGTQSLSADRHVDTPLVLPLGCITHVWTLEIKEAVHDYPTNS